MEGLIERAKKLVAEATEIVALTGAGISAESGIPTFRGEDGLWKNHRPEVLATAEAFAEDPKLVWEWYNWRRGKIGEAKPNPGHCALAELEKKKSFTLVTQNIDGLHALAGSENMYELHGCVWRVRCLGCGEIREDRRVPVPEVPPHCRCGGMLRPDVVWFGEALPQEPLARSMAAAQMCDLMMVIGTSAVVYPAAGVAQIAIQTGVPVIEINPGETEITPYVTVSLREKSGAVLPQII
ncbi:MAG: SIR2 family NAD-dependent protein deacylase [Planctomycetota bacterium]|jgi:NAD-dependent deacetylase